jgi:hypothetical protein
MLNFPSWDQWLRRKLTEGFDSIQSPEDKFRFNRESEEELGKDYEKIRNELFSNVMDKFPDETRQFLDGIRQRGDNEINQLIRELDGLKNPPNPDFEKPRHPTEGDNDVVPSSADSGHSDGDFGGEE